MVRGSKFFFMVEEKMVIEWEVSVSFFYLFMNVLRGLEICKRVGSRSLGVNVFEGFCIVIFFEEGLILGGSMVLVG